MNLRDLMELEKENEGLTSIRAINGLRKRKGLSKLTKEQIEGHYEWQKISKQMTSLKHNFEKSSEEIKKVLDGIKDFFIKFQLQLKNDYDKKLSSYENYLRIEGNVIPEDFESFFKWYGSREDIRNKPIEEITKFEFEDFLKYNQTFVIRHKNYKEEIEKSQIMSIDSNQQNHDSFKRLSQVAFYCYCMEIDVTNGNQDKILEEVKSKLNLTSPKLTNSEGTFKEHYDKFKHSIDIGKNLEADRKAVLNVLLSLKEQKAYQKAIDYSPKVYKND